MSRDSFMAALWEAMAAWASAAVPEEEVEEKEVRAPLLEPPMTG